MTDESEEQPFEPMGMTIPDLGELEILAPDDARLRLLSGKVEYCNDPAQVAEYYAMVRRAYEQATANLELVPEEEQDPDELVSEETSRPPDPFWNIGKPEHSRLSSRERHKRQKQAKRQRRR